MMKKGIVNHGFNNRNTKFSFMASNGLPFFSSQQSKSKGWVIGCPHFRSLMIKRSKFCNCLSFSMHKYDILH